MYLLTYVSYTYATIKLVTNLLTYLPSVPTYSLPYLTIVDYLDHQLTNHHTYLSYLTIYLGYLPNFGYQHPYLPTHLSTCLGYLPI